MSRTVITAERPMVQMTADDCGCTFVMARGRITGNVIACGSCDWCNAHPDLLRPARGPRPCDDCDEKGLWEPAYEDGEMICTCPCNGTGTIYDIIDARCSRCGGTGNELLSLYRKCSRCEGTGTVRARLDSDVEWWDHDKDYRSVAAFVYEVTDVEQHEDPR